MLAGLSDVRPPQPSQPERPTWRRIASVATTIVLWAVFAIVALLVLAVLVVPRVTGAIPLTVLSGSMEPTLSPGAVVIVRPVDLDTLAIGDIITFQPHSGEPELITHRIVGISAGGDEAVFRTKGDANDAVDPAPVRAAQIKGEVWYDVPSVGYALDELDGGKRTWGVRVIGAGLALWSAWLIGSGLFARRRSNLDPPPT